MMKQVTPCCYRVTLGGEGADGVASAAPHARAMRDYCDCAAAGG